MATLAGLVTDQFGILRPRTQHQARLRHIAGIQARAAKAVHSRGGPMSPAGPVRSAGVFLETAVMGRTGRRRNDGKSSLELKKLRAETRIAERQLEEMRLRMIYETIKVGVGVLIAFNATVVMSKTIGLFF